MYVYDSVGIGYHYSSSISPLPIYWGMVTLNLTLRCCSCAAICAVTPQYSQGLVAGVLLFLISLYIFESQQHIVSSVRASNHCMKLHAVAVVCLFPRVVRHYNSQMPDVNLNSNSVFDEQGCYDEVEEERRTMNRAPASSMTDNLPTSNKVWRRCIMRLMQMCIVVILGLNSTQSNWRLLWSCSSKCKTRSYPDRIRNMCPTQ